MDGRAMLADLFGRGSEGTVRLHRAAEARTAVMKGERIASCEGVTVISDHPIAALCGALVAEGKSDSAMQVTTRLGKAVCFVESIHQTARAAARKP